MFLIFQQRWVAILSSEYPTMAFHASITNPFGKGAMITLLRQFAKVNKCTMQNTVLMHSYFCLCFMLNTVYWCIYLWENVKKSYNKKFKVIKVWNNDGETRSTKTAVNVLILFSSLGQRPCEFFSSLIHCKLSH
jgi:hypothetical protein